MMTFDEVGAPARLFGGHSVAKHSSGSTWGALSPLFCQCEDWVKTYACAYCNMLCPLLLRINSILNIMKENREAFECTV